MRSPPSIDFPAELSSLPVQVLNDGSKLTECCALAVFSQHPFGNIASITNSVSLLAVKIFASVVNCVVKSRNFNQSILVILRSLIFSLESALQHFQPTWQTLKEFRRLDEDPIPSCQKILQPHIYPPRMTLGNGSQNPDITDIDSSVPLVGTPRDSHLLDKKSTGYGWVQIDGYCSNLRQFNCQWILLKLTQQQRFEMPVFLEAEKAKVSRLEVFPTSMKLFNRFLDNLRKKITEYRKLFVGSRQVMKLVDNAGKLQVSRQDVLFVKIAFINRTVTAIAQIFYLSQGIVVSKATDFHRLNKHWLLSGIWIYGIKVVKCQHSRNIGFNGQNATLSVNFRKSKTLKLTWGSPCIPWQIKDYGEGIIANPNTLGFDKSLTKLRFI